MYEQASKLRHIVAQKKTSIYKPKNIKVYCVSSGKGGVGKTNVSVNIAIALQSMGERILIIDADLGLANIDVVSGLYPKYNLSHILTLGKPISDVILEGPMGVSILPGASGIQKMANLSDNDLRIIADSFKSIESNYDKIIIDTGAGISDNVISFIKSSNEVIVVTTPEPTAVTDAYALIKIAYRYCDNINVIVNKADNYKEAKHTMEKLFKAAEKFLNIKINYLGFLLEDRAVHRSNMVQTPFYIKHPDSLASKCILNISKKLLHDEGQVPNEPVSTIDSWFRKLMTVIKEGMGAE
ncbi:MAG TPA: MinD/ParA family protein [Thermoanaerobacterales bacterium]|nr:MinD/ParA family protein [Thermoanaerobacterales bacterium]